MLICPECKEEFKTSVRLESHLINKHEYTYDYALTLATNQLEEQGKIIRQKFSWDLRNPKNKI